MPQRGCRHTCYICEAYRRHISKQKQRKIDTTLTEEEFYTLVLQECFYCEGETWTNSELKMNGIDRVLNNYGYHAWNCVPCCQSCNKFKSDKDYPYVSRFHKNFILAIEQLEIPPEFL